MKRMLLFFAASAAALGAMPARAITSNLVRTFTRQVLADFDALALGPLAPGTEVLPGVSFAGAYPPFITGPSAAVVAEVTGASLEIADGQSVAFSFATPVEDVGATVRKLSGDNMDQVTVYALDAMGAYLWGFGYLYGAPVGTRYPEVVQATATPISIFLIKAGLGTYRVDDLEYAPEPTGPAAGLASLVALAALRHRRRYALTRGPGPRR